MLAGSGQSPMLQLPLSLLLPLLLSEQRSESLVLPNPPKPE